jgi:outer membrane protein assembly factor BamB/tetratricopeptide (TPR) repeat protein
MSTTIFCPTCQTLILDASRCAHCQWERPAQPSAERGAVAWQVTLPAALDSSLTVAEGTLYLGDAAGKLHAFDATTGQPRWPQPVDLAGWRIYRQAAVAQGRVIVGPSDKAAIPAADKAVLALDVGSGRELWRRPLAVRQVSDPLVAGDTIYVATSDGYAAALALADAAVRWRSLIAGVCLAAPAWTGELVVYGGDKGVLTALRAADGQPAWSFTADAGGQWGVQFPYPAAVADGVLYVTCWNGRCYALAADTAALLWAFGPTKRPPMTPPLVAGDAVYFCAHDRYVYCLERGTGRQRWRTQLERRSQTTPLLIEGRLYVASQNHQVYALDPATGAPEEKPLLETPRHVEADWASDGERIYLGDCEGHLFALAVRAPREETDPEKLIAQGKWADAAGRLALAGDFRRAGDIYRDQLREPRCAAQLYERGGEPGLAAEMYEQAGNDKIARRLYREARRFADAGRLSERLGDLAGAAQDYEAASQPDRAARFCEQLGLWAQAASLYEEAAEAARQAGRLPDARDNWYQAAEIYYRSLRQPEKAVQLYKQAGRTDRLDHVIAEERDPKFQIVISRLFYGPDELIRRLSEQGRYVAAAEECLRLARPTDAGRLYEQAAEYALAAEQYRAAGLPGEAARVLELAGDWPRAAALYAEAGNRKRAGDLYTRAGNHQAAAENYEASGWPALAAEQWERLEQWERAAGQWRAAGEHRRAAEAWLRLNACDRAAESYWFAAQAAQAAKRLAEEVATLYDLACQNYLNCSEERQAQECDRLRRWLRKQPLLQVNAPTLDEFTLGDSAKLNIVIANVGWGMAREISFDVRGEFQADKTRVSKIPGLAADVERTQPLYIIPQRTGRQVPLDLIIAYADQAGAAMPPLMQTFDITVRDKAGRIGDSTPQQIIVQQGGQVIQAPAASKVEVGDKYSVEVKRQTAASATAGGLHVTMTDGGPASPAETQMVQCSNCGERQPGGRFKCSRCGAPLMHEE